MPTEVPLWMAKLLAQRRLAQIQPPRWLESEGLSELLRRERETTVLTLDLPFHYYEIARSLSSVIDKPTLVVLQDLVAVRVDKIRRHFHDLLVSEHMRDLDHPLDNFRRDTWDGLLPDLANWCVNLSDSLHSLHLRHLDGASLGIASTP